MSERQSKQTGLYVLAAANLLLVGLVAALLFSGYGPGGSKATGAGDERAVATALANRGLYQQAADAYGHYLDTADLDAEQRANILYTVGNLYMDKLKDPGEALARYERIHTLYPDTKIAAEVGPKIVTCLEQLGQSLDAQNMLDRATRPGDKKTDDTSLVLARIGKTEITERDLADEIAALPAQVGRQIQGRAAKLEVLHSIVQRNLMVNAALRKGLDRDPDVIAEIEQARKGVLAGRVLREDVMDKIDITPAQVAAYVQDHPAEFVDKDGKPLEPQAAQQRAAQKLFEQEHRRLSTKLFESLSAAQSAEVYEDRVK